MFYRLFIDETGTHDLKGRLDPNNRYLSLTGLIFNSSEIETRLEPAVAAFKRKHLGHLTEPENIILHRKEIINKKAPFEVLFDPAKEQKFNADLLMVAERLNYRAITVTIDKHEHLERYRVWHADPYHYCMEAMLERYCMHLRGLSTQGDVMIEARNKTQDKKLKNSFKRVYENGTTMMNRADMQRALTSREIKIKPKAENIAGLQLCDLLAHPACSAARYAREGKPLPANFGGKLAQILEEKYRRSYYGKIDGYGRKWLP